RIRLIGNAPHNDAGMVLIPGDQFSYDVLVVLLGLHSVLFIICADLLAVKVRPSAEFKVDAYRCRLIDDYKAFFVAEPPHLLAVWVMACAAAVCPLPLHHRHILCIHGKIHASSIVECVLMPAVAFEIE